MSYLPHLSTNEEMIQHGLHHLVNHNEKAAFPQPQATYAIPQDSTYQFPNQHQTMQYQHKEEYDRDRLSTPAPSPLSMAAQDALKTRSGLAIQRNQPLKPKPEARSRVEKSPPKSKRARKDRIKNDKVAKLDKPLSELTKDWKENIVDIEAYVNRSAEDRRKEIHEGKNPGKIKRPMNSFMLYRKAYQNRTKDWCLQNNHQVVSQVCGDSWPLEPEEIKEQFNEWARIERINHQKAHPGYKFTPSKPGMAKASNKRKSGSPEPDESDLEDFDWQGRTRKAKKTRAAARVVEEIPQPVAWPTTRSAYQYDLRDGSVEADYGGYHPPSYQMNNAGRPYPAQYDLAALEQGQYYQQTVRHHTPIPGAEDVMYTKTSAPQPNAYVGYQGHEYDMFEQQPQYTHSNPIDPSLLAQGHNEYVGYLAPHPDDIYFNTSHKDGQQQWVHDPYAMIDQEINNPTLPYPIDPALDDTKINDPHADVLKGSQDGWQVETLDAWEFKFDNWMEAE